MTPILQLDIAGNPSAWITHRDAITMMAVERVIAGIGDIEFVFRGGINRASGNRSEMIVSSILITKQRVVAHRLSREFEPPLTNRALFARDRNLCLYCGNTYSFGRLTRDHVLPLSRLGPDSWNNCVTACRKCNHAKNNRTPEEWGNLLLAVPFTPTWAEYLYLKNSHKIITDQMDFLLERFPKDSRLLL